jgi:hypothetical protein
MADLKQLMSEYREHVKALEFGNRTDETYNDWIDWNQENAETLQAFGIHTADLFDQVYSELEHLLQPRPNQREVVHQWHRDNSAALLAQGIYSYDEVFYAVDELKETYTNGKSSDLQKALVKIASIPLMTTEVLQEIIYESCRDLPIQITGLNKVTINV